MPSTVQYLGDILSLLYVIKHMVCDDITLSFCFVSVSFIRKGRIVSMDDSFCLFVKLPSDRTEVKRLRRNQAIVLSAFMIRCAV